MREHPVVESYLKARVTLDCSYGGPDSVNATVPTAEREISLPRVQHLARAAAIIDLAARDANATAAKMIREGELRDWRELKAISYNIDEEMAYYYVPAQVMDHWENTYFWFDNRGAPGVCRCWRLGTGGAWSPNKFQRISTIIMAWAQRERREFDREFPPPLPVRLWGMSRANSQIRGDLPPGEEQTEPAYCHVYIDDNAGSALNDRVPTPPYLQGIKIDPKPTQALGGEFPEADSRVLVHAKILLCAMTMAGFYAAPDKILIGDPLVSLGFLISRSENRLKLPQVKQALTAIPPVYNPINGKMTPWVDVTAAFATLDDAAAYALDVTNAPAIVKRAVSVFQAHLEQGLWRSRHIQALGADERSRDMFIAIYECTKDLHRGRASANAAQVQKLATRNTLCLCHSTCPAETQAWSRCVRTAARAYKAKAPPPPEDCRAWRKELERCTQRHAAALLQAAVVPRPTSAWPDPDR